MYKKKRKKDIENGNDIEAIYVLKVLCSKMDNLIYDCIAYHSVFMNEIFEEKIGNKLYFVAFYKKYGNDKIVVIFNDIFLCEW